LHTIYSRMYAFVKKNNFLLLGAKRQSNIGLTLNACSWAKRRIGVVFAWSSRKNH